LPQELQIKFTSSGQVETPWWTPELAILLCNICGRGGGWPEFGPITPEEAMAYINGQKETKWGACFYCQVRHPYCG